MCGSRSCEACWEPLDVGSVAGNTQGSLRCVCRASESVYVGDAFGRTPLRSHSLHNRAATGGGGSGLTGMDTLFSAYLLTGQQPRPQAAQWEIQCYPFLCVSEGGGNLLHKPIGLNHSAVMV